MADDEQYAEQRRLLLEKTRSELYGNATSNAEAFDRALLMLSSAFLSGSLAFIDKIVPSFPGTACAKPILYFSWFLFALTIGLTVASLMYGVLSFRWVSQAAERYYEHQDETAWHVSDETQRAVMRFIWACGIAFIAAIFFLVCLCLLTYPWARHGDGFSRLRPGDHSLYPAHPPPLTFLLSLARSRSA